MGGPLRVLHVVVNMNRGGAETLIMNLYRNIDRTKVQFDFLTCKEGVFDKEITELGGVVHRIPYLTDVGHLGYLKALDQFFDEHSDYKIVHSHLDKMSGFVLRAAKKFGIPVRIAHSHNTQSEGGVAARIYKTYSGNYIKSHATHLFACSKAAANWLYGKKSNEAFLLKNGIECEKFQFSRDVREKMRNEFNISEDTLVIGHVGRFNQQKNHVFILEVFSGLLRRRPNSVLLLAGDGILRSKIEEKVKELNLVNKVLFLGVRPDIHQLLQAFDLFLFPSLHEGLPVTLIEAQGAGLPCFISDSITKEVDMGVGLVHYLSISEINQWIDLMSRFTSSKNERNIGASALMETGYDIRKTANQIQQSYALLGGESLEAIDYIHPNL